MHTPVLGPLLDASCPGWVPPRGCFRMIVDVSSDESETPGETLPTSDPVELVRSLVIATYHHDRDERKRCSDLLDEQGWDYAVVLLAALKITALERLSSTIERVGTALWIQTAAKDLVSRHSEWMRLVPGQIVAMLRAGLGQHELALIVPKPQRGRLDATLVEFLIEELMDYRGSFTEAFDELLKGALVLSTRRAFIEEYEGR